MSEDSELTKLKNSRSIRRGLVTKTENQIRNLLQNFDINNIKDEAKLKAFRNLYDSRLQSVKNLDESILNLTELDDYEAEIIDSEEFYDTSFVLFVKIDQKLNRNRMTTMTLPGLLNLNHGTSTNSNPFTFSTPKPKIDYNTEKDFKSIPKTPETLTTLKENNEQNLLKEHLTTEEYFQTEKPIGNVQVDDVSLENTSSNEFNKSLKTEPEYSEPESDYVETFKEKLKLNCDRLDEVNLPFTPYPDFLRDNYIEKEKHFIYPREQLDDVLNLLLEYDRNYYDLSWKFILQKSPWWGGLYEKLIIGIT